MNRQIVTENLCSGSQISPATFGSVPRPGAGPAEGGAQQAPEPAGERPLHAIATSRNDPGQ